jgi:CTP:molybdopterin cytidylyltransferase MocA
MPFIEPWMIEKVLSQLGGESNVEIAHSGEPDGVRPPTAFSSACFKALLVLSGDDGAKRVIGQGGFNVAGASIPAPLLADVDTKEELALARKQFEIRSRHRSDGP